MKALESFEKDFRTLREKFMIDLLTEDIYAFLRLMENEFEDLTKLGTPKYVFSLGLEILNEMNIYDLLDLFQDNRSEYSNTICTQFDYWYHYFGEVDNINKGER